MSDVEIKSPPPERSSGHKKISRRDIFKLTAATGAGLLATAIESSPVGRFTKAFAQEPVESTELIDKEKLYEQKRHLYISKWIDETPFHSVRELTENLSELRTKIDNFRNVDIESGFYNPDNGIYPLEFLYLLQERQEQILKTPEKTMFDATVGDLRSLAKDMEQKTKIPSDVWLALVFRESGGISHFSHALRDWEFMGNGDGVTGANPHIHADRDYQTSGSTSTSHLAYSYKGHDLVSRALGVGVTIDAMQSMYLGGLIYTDAVRTVQTALANGPDGENAFHMSSRLAQGGRLVPDVSQEVNLSGLNFNQLVAVMHKAGLSEYAIAYSIYHHGAYSFYQKINDRYPSPDPMFARMNIALSLAALKERPNQPIEDYFIDPAARFDKTLKLTPWNNPYFVGDRGGPGGEKYQFMGYERWENFEEVAQKTITEIDHGLSPDNIAVIGGNQGYDSVKKVEVLFDNLVQLNTRKSVYLIFINSTDSELPDDEHKKKTIEIIKNEMQYLSEKDRNTVAVVIDPRLSNEIFDRYENSDLRPSFIYTDGRSFVKLNDN